MIYEKINNRIYQFGDDGEVVRSITVSDKSMLEYNKAIEEIKSLHMSELFASMERMEHRTKVYHEQLFKLFGESTKE